MDNSMLLTFRLDVLVILKARCEDDGNLIGTVPRHACMCGLVHRLGTDASIAYANPLLHGSDPTARYRKVWLISAHAY